MRFLSFTLLTTAAFDWPLPWLDRAGTALLGLAFLALAVSLGGFRVARPARMALPPKAATLLDEEDTLISDVLARIGAYER
jgi:hypothetical protein